jgi:CubicO group peptidase (beta-lactamase class C family)/ABC-type branched-subunit amino acid transport system substrate-binding protein
MRSDSFSGPSRPPTFRPGSLLPATLSLACLAVALGPASATLHAQPAPLQGLDRFVERGMADWGIPGLAVAVVKDDRVVFARGYGALGHEDARAVDEHTLFGIASVSKAFTAAALGILVDEGLVDWDDPVVKHLPDFRLYDPYVTETATIRDLLSHRVGVGRLTGNRLRWLPSRELSELIYRVRYLGPEQTFREGYVYSNVMYMVAGQVIPAVTGMSWGEFVEERLFAPLGMERSNTSITALMEGENAALPHQEIDGEVVPIPRRNFDAVGPAASINSSVAELAAWMRLHLGEPGMFDGRRILTEATAREMHRAQSRIPDGGPPGDLASYGLGLRLGYYEGLRTSSHGGATDGMNTNMVLVPELDLGIIVTTNTFNTFMNALANRIVDRYLGLEDRDWHATYHQGFLGQKTRVQAIRDSIQDARERDTSPSLPLEAYAGSYFDSLYADARVEHRDGGLVLTFWDDPDMTADLEHWHHDTFRAVWRNRSIREEFVRFTRGWDGEVDAMHIEWVLRPLLLQVGAYPSTYTREARLERVPDPIRIGATMSLSGAYSTQGIPAANGYRLCQDHVNAGGGILGRDVRFIIHDDRSETGRAMELYERLITEEGVDAIMGPYGSTLTEAVAPVTERHRMVHISPLAATTSIWEQGRRYLFMVLPPAELFLAGLIDLAAEEGYRSVAVLHEDVLFPGAAARGAADRARERRMEVIVEAAYPSGTTDFSEFLARVRDEGVEVVAMAASTLSDFVLVTRQMKELDVNPRIFGTSGAVAEFQEALGRDGEYVFGLSAWEPSLPNPGIERFLSTYRSRFGQEPSFHAAGAYGSCQLFVEAAERAGSLDSDALRTELLSMETTTVFGEYAVDERGYQTANRGVLIQWQDGEKVVVWPEDLATATARIPTPAWGER